MIGAGQLGKLLLQLWPKNIMRPSLFLDEKVLNTVEGIEVQKTSEHLFVSSNLYVLAYFMSDGKSINTLFRDVIKQEIVTAYDLLNLFQPDLFSNGWTGDNSKKTIALEGLQYFEDARSKETLISVVQWRYERILQERFSVSPETQKYDLTKYGVQPSEYDFICDAGSYDLSFLHKQASLGAIPRKIVAIEPDTNRLKIIEQLVETPKYGFLQRVSFHLEKRALWHKTGVTQFYNNGTLAARIARNPDSSCIEVETISLPDLFSELEIQRTQNSLVKLHIEGAESPVIESSIEFLLTFERLDLLINLSHDEDSLVKIPRLLGSSGKYRLALDSHALFGEGLTLFAKRR